MKRFVLMLICLVLSTGPTAAATITEMWIIGKDDGQYRTDTSAYHGFLGVSAIGENLLNQPNTDGSYYLSNLPLGKYNLYMDSDTYLYSHPGINFIVNFSDGSNISAEFNVQGINGSGLSWVQTSGSPLISLGWGFFEGAAPDIVGAKGIGSNQNPDFLFNVEVKNTVPIPAAAWLLGSGFLGLIALKRRSQR